MTEFVIPVFKEQDGRLRAWHCIPKENVEKYVERTLSGTGMYAYRGSIPVTLKEGVWDENNHGDGYVYLNVYKEGDVLAPGRFTLPGTRAGADRNAGTKRPEHERVSCIRVNLRDYVLQVKFVE